MGEASATGRGVQELATRVQGTAREGRSCAAFGMTTVPAEAGSGGQIDNPTSGADGAAPIAPAQASVPAAAGDLDAQSLPVEKTPAEKVKSAAKRHIPRIVIVICVLFLIRTLSRIFKDELEAFFEWADRERPQSLFVFVAVEACGVAITVPYTMFALGGGFVFGFPLGYLCNVAGWSFSMLLTLAIVRNPATVGRRESWRRRLFEKYDRIRILGEMIDDRPYFSVQRAFLARPLSSGQHNTHYSRALARTHRKTLSNQRAGDLVPANLAANLRQKLRPGCHRRTGRLW